MKSELPIKECAIELPEGLTRREPKVRRDLYVLVYITFSMHHLPTHSSMVIRVFIDKHPDKLEFSLLTLFRFYV
jgi:hypothetical protein